MKLWMVSIIVTIFIVMITSAYFIIKKHRKAEARAQSVLTTATELMLSACTDTKHYEIYCGKRKALFEKCREQFNLMDGCTAEGDVSEIIDDILSAAEQSSPAESWMQKLDQANKHMMKGIIVNWVINVSPIIQTSQKFLKERLDMAQAGILTEEELESYLPIRQWIVTETNLIGHEAESVEKGWGEKVFQEAMMFKKQSQSQVGQQMQMQAMLQAQMIQAQKAAAAAAEAQASGDVEAAAKAAAAAATQQENMMRFLAMAKAKGMPVRFVPAPPGTGPMTQPNATPPPSATN